MRLAIADLAAYRRDPRGLVEAAARRPGPVAELRLGRHALLLKQPDDVRHVLATNHAAYEKAPRLLSSRARRIAGAGVFTATMQQAKESKRALRPLYDRSTVSRAVDSGIAAADRSLDTWTARGSLDLASELVGVARLAMLRAMLGVEGDEASRLGEALELRRRALERTLTSLLAPAPFAPVALRPSRRRAVASAERTLRETIAARRAEPRDDLASVLTSQDVGLDDRQACSELLGLMLTGYVTIARALTWTWLELLSAPALALELRAEVDAALGGRLPTTVDAARLPFTGACVEEALRLHPPTPIYVRLARLADTLPSGAVVKPGMLVLVCPYVLHRDPRWFEDPEAYAPRRFLPEGQAVRPSFAYVPFGGGPRLCRGRTVALLESTLLLARVAQRFEVSPTGAIVSRPDVGLNLALPGGLAVQVAERKGSRV